MNNSLIDVYEKQLSALLPDREIPKKQDRELKELLSKIERVAKNHGMNLKTYLLILGFHFGEDTSEGQTPLAKIRFKKYEQVENQIKERLLELYPHKKVYGLSTKDKKLSLKIASTMKHRNWDSRKGYLHTLGFKLITGYKLTNLLLGLDEIAVHRIIIALPTHTDLNEKLQTHITAKGTTVENFFKNYMYKDYSKLTIHSFKDFTEDMVVDVLRKVFPDNLVTDRTLIAPAIPRYLKKHLYKTGFKLDEWLISKGFKL